LEVSATECTASASIDELPVMMNPTNLAAAMPAFAESAAMMARLLPDADMSQPLRQMPTVARNSVAG
jgi:hypothetical protein